MAQLVALQGELCKANLVAAKLVTSEGKAVAKFFTWFKSKNEQAHSGEPKQSPRQSPRVLFCFHLPVLTDSVLTACREQGEPFSVRKRFLLGVSRVCHLVQVPK